LRFHSAVLSNQAGSGIILILVLATVASISMMGAITLGGIQQKTRTQSMLPFHVQIWRGNIMSILTNSANFAQTATDLTNNPSMGCVNNLLIACPGSAEQVFYVRSVIDTGINPAYRVGGFNGITPAGQTCTDFPSDTCPTRFNVFWTCTTNCTVHPSGTRTFSVQITPEYNPGSPNAKNQVAFDPSKYNIPSKPVGTPVDLSLVFSNP
jgi:hypothetical protein